MLLILNSTLISFVYYLKGFETHYSRFKQNNTSVAKQQVSALVVFVGVRYKYT